MSRLSRYTKTKPEPVRLVESHLCGEVGSEHDDTVIPIGTLKDRWSGKKVDVNKSVHENANKFATFSSKNGGFLMKRGWLGQRDGQEEHDPRPVIKQSNALFACPRCPDENESQDNSDEPEPGLIDLGKLEVKNRFTDYLDCLEDSEEEAVVDMGRVIPNAVVEAAGRKESKNGHRRVPKLNFESQESDLVIGPNLTKQKKKRPRRIVHGLVFERHCIRDNKPPAACKKNFTRGLKNKMFNKKKAEEEPDNNRKKAAVVFADIKNSDDDEEEEEEEKPPQTMLQCPCCGEQVAEFEELTKKDKGFLKTICPFLNKEKKCPICCSKVLVK